MDVLVIPSGINPLDASFPSDGGGCAYNACPHDCPCNSGGCYNKKCTIDLS